ncbi:MAG: DUF1285 domain-containing protein [Inquilinus sp.]|nr:DUF1285 domain-containing protein [Inquilinus sp.]
MAKMGNDRAGIEEKLRAARDSARSDAPRSYDIRIAADGTWFYRGSPIERLALVKLFASVLRRDDAGDYWLVTPAERGRIEVDDAPFTAVELSVEDPAGDGGPDQRLGLRSNLDHRIEAGTDHPLRIAFNPETGEPRPYILVSEGLEALIVRPVYYQLVDRAVEHDDRVGVWSGGRFFPLDQRR